MRILMISGRADFGGGPEHVYQLAKALARRAEIYIACPREEPYWERFQQVAGAEHMLEIPHRRLSFAALRAIVRLIREEKIDIVHSHGRTAGVYGRPAALLAGKPCVHTAHGGKPVENLKTLGFAIAEYLFSFITKKVIAVSSTEAKVLRTLCALRGQIKVITNGVEIPPSIIPPETRLREPLRVIHSTRFEYQKRTCMLVDILLSLRKLGALDRFKFVILGDGPERAEFESKLRANGLECAVDLVGAVRNPGDYLCDAFGLISTSRWEGLPLVTLEAMARGVPAIATDVMGNRDAVVHGETGFLYDPAAPSAAAERLAQLADDQTLWESFARSAREHAERKYSVSTMAETTLELYRTLLLPREQPSRAPRKLPRRLPV